MHKVKSALAQMKERKILINEPKFQPRFLPSLVGRIYLGGKTDQYGN